jgi:hypothetical protein
MLVTCVLYDPLMLYKISNFPVYGLCICVRLMYVCVAQCMDYVLDNLCCSNSQNLCLTMFLSILYIVFYPFSSMLQIVHTQSVYNVNKSVAIICMIFVDFFRFFLPRETPKPTGSVCSKFVQFIKNSFSLSL